MRWFALALALVLGGLQVLTAHAEASRRTTVSSLSSYADSPRSSSGAVRLTTDATPASGAPLVTGLDAADARVPRLSSELPSTPPPTPAHAAAPASGRRSGASRVVSVAALGRRVSTLPVPPDDESAPARAAAASNAPVITVPPPVPSAEAAPPAATPAVASPTTGSSSSSTAAPPPTPPAAHPRRRRAAARRVHPRPVHTAADVPAAAAAGTEILRTDCGELCACRPAAGVCLCALLPRNNGTLTFNDSRVSSEAYETRLRIANSTFCDTQGLTPMLAGEFISRRGVPTPVAAAITSAFAANPRATSVSVATPRAHRHRHNSRHNLTEADAAAARGAHRSPHSLQALLAAARRLIGFGAPPGQPTLFSAAAADAPGSDLSPLLSRANERRLERLKQHLNVEIARAALFNRLADLSLPERLATSGLGGDGRAYAAGDRSGLRRTHNDKPQTRGPTSSTSAAAAGIAAAATAPTAHTNMTTNVQPAAAAAARPTVSERRAALRRAVADSHAAERISEIRAAAASAARRRANSSGNGGYRHWFGSGARATAADAEEGARHRWLYVVSARGRFMRRFRREARASTEAATSGSAFAVSTTAIAAAGPAPPGAVPEHTPVTGGRRVTTLALRINIGELLFGGGFSGGDSANEIDRVSGSNATLVAERAKVKQQILALADDDEVKHAVRFLAIPPSLAALVIRRVAARPEQAHTLPRAKSTAEMFARCCSGDMGGDDRAKAGCCKIDKAIGALLKSAPPDPAVAERGRGPRVERIGERTVNIYASADDDAAAEADTADSHGVTPAQPISTMFFSLPSSSRRSSRGDSSTNNVNESDLHSRFRRRARGTPADGISAPLPRPPLAASAGDTPLPVTESAAIAAAFPYHTAPHEDLIGAPRLRAARRARPPLRTIAAANDDAVTAAVAAAVALVRSVAAVSHGRRVGFDALHTRHSAPPSPQPPTSAGAVAARTEAAAAVAPAAAAVDSAGGSGSRALSEYVVRLRYPSPGAAAAEARRQRDAARARWRERQNARTAPGAVETVAEPATDPRRGARRVRRTVMRTLAVSAAAGAGSGSNEASARRPPPPSPVARPSPHAPAPPLPPVQPPHRYDEVSRRLRHYARRQRAAELERRARRQRREERTRARARAALPPGAAAVVSGAADSTRARAGAAARGARGSDERARLRMDEEIERLLHRLHNTAGDSLLRGSVAMVPVSGATAGGAARSAA